MPWNGYPTGRAPVRRSRRPPAAGEPAPKVVVDQEEYNFGTMDFGSERSHDFTFTMPAVRPWC